LRKPASAILIYYASALWKTFAETSWRTGTRWVETSETRNKEFVSNVQKAVEQAFVVRARQPPISET